MNFTKYPIIILSFSIIIKVQQYKWKLEICHLSTLLKYCKTVIRGLSTLPFLRAYTYILKISLQ